MDWVPDLIAGLRPRSSLENGIDCDGPGSRTSETHWASPEFPPARLDCLLPCQRRSADLRLLLTCWEQLVRERTRLANRLHSDLG